jgi:hypothetical protein
MQTVLHSFLLDVPQAAVIWLALLVPAIAALTGVLVRAGRMRRDPDDPAPAGGSEPVTAEAHPSGEPRKAPAGDTKPRGVAQELRRFAEEVAVAADRAAAMARRRREQWLAAQGEVETAWQACEAADSAARRVAATMALPAPRTPRTPAEYADRERYLHRVAMAACWRRELSILQLSDALAHRDGWDPRRHPAEQEVHLWTVVRDGALAAHRAAVARERDAWQVAEAAGAAARSLRDEAYAAAVHAWQAQHGRARENTRARPKLGEVWQPRPAVHWRPA